MLIESFVMSCNSVSDSSVILDVNEIQKFIPHRYPFLLIDKVYDICINASCRAIKNVTINEWYFAGHFPSRPIMPGVLIVEGMAQAAGVLACYSVLHDNPDFQQKQEMYFMTIDGVKFRSIVSPSDSIVMNIDVVQKRGESVWKFKGVATVQNKVVCEAEFMAMTPGKSKDDMRA